jgi:hypothetical protein
LVSGVRAYRLLAHRRSHDAGPPLHLRPLAPRSVSVGPIVIGILLLWPALVIFLLVRFTAFIPEIASDRREKDVFERTWQLTSGHFWQIVRFMLLSMLILFAGLAALGIGFLFALSDGRRIVGIVLQRAAQGSEEGVRRNAYDLSAHGSRMIRTILIAGVLLILASCSSVRDIESYQLTIEPTGLGFACVIDGDAPDAWIVTGFGDVPGPIEYEAISPVRIEFEPFVVDYDRVECTAVYPEGNRTAMIRLT